MARLSLMFALAAVTLAAIPAAAPKPHSIYVAVTDMAGAPITGLAPADFTVEVNDRPVQILDATRAADPAQVAVVFNFKQPEGIGTFAGAVLDANPSSSAAIASFASERDHGSRYPLDLPPFSSDIKTIEAGLAAQRDRDRGFSDNFMSLAPLGRLTDACRALGSISATRPVIVVYLDEAHDSGGMLGIAPNDRVFSAPDATEALKRAVGSSRAAIWTIVTPRQLTTQKVSEIAPEFAAYSVAYRFMSAISSASGGAVLLSGTSASDTTAAFRRVGQAIVSQYRLTFEADATSSLKLRVKVRRDAARVLAPDHLDLP